jgi:hypothetical protein
LKNKKESAALTLARIGQDGLPEGDLNEKAFRLLRSLKGFIISFASESNLSSQ